MFDSEFFPTPHHVIDMMGIDCYDKVVLEPQAGSGNIVEWLNLNGAREVLAVEQNEKLRSMLRGCSVIEENSFNLKAEDISHVQLIVMNPPFSNAASHILHLWNIAPEGCELISLCNYETLNKQYYGRNRELANVVDSYGEGLNLGSVFAQAERTTNVEIGLVRLFKPVVSETADLDGFYLDMDEHAGGGGIMRYDEIRAVVQNYVGAVRAFEKVAEAGKELNRYTQTKFGNREFSFGSEIAFQATSRGEGITNKHAFARAFQRKCWQFIFDIVGIEKYVTRGVMADINKFIDSRKNYPFTVKNVYRMLEIIVGTRGETMQRAIVEAVDNFTKHTHENRYGVEGWKTNEGHLLNQKFIIPYIADVRWSGNSRLSIRQGKYYSKALEDLVKALCFVTGKRYEAIPDIRTASCVKGEDGMYSDRNGILRERPDYSSNGFDAFEPNKWYDWGFFQFKVFKKGTGHFKFKSLDDWGQLNRAYAKAKGQTLPEKL